MDDDFDLEELEELYNNVDDMSLDDNLQKDIFNKVAMIILLI